MFVCTKIVSILQNSEFQYEIKRKTDHLILEKLSFYGNTEFYDIEIVKKYGALYHLNCT